MDISIIILNYKSKGFTLNCIKSIKEADFDSLKYEIIVVDNNSEDSIGQILAWQNPEVLFVQNKENIGMGAGNNAGIRKSQGKYVVIMNPDTIAFKDVFLKLYDYMETNKSVGVVGPMQLNPDKSIQNSCYRWHSPLLPIYRRTPLGRLKHAKKEIDKFLMKDFDHQSERKVDWLLGSFLFCRREALLKVGMFDDRYFMYFEDTDLCRAFHNNKWEVIYYPEAKIIHNHMRQSASIAWYKFFVDSSARWHILSWLKYLLKWGIDRPSN